MVSDEELIRAFKHGDKAAFEAFVHRYHSPLLGFLQRMLHDTEKAEDLVQETFIRVMRYVHKEQPPAKIKPWVYQVALNLCRDYWKSAGYRSERRGLEQIPEQKDPRPSVIEIYERQEERQAIIRALDLLPDIQKQIVILRFYQELKLQEISDTLKLPLGTVKTYLYRALKTLKSTLNEGKEETQREQRMS
ncbi:RNA polymerase sigma-70 factor (ECF subfamily) [Caldalkalibacillus uzonensis]|uniref:RNA polymerase sigma-70 factor (ECF subfamily) n=1 Tax=Caldalkalibacillus uzonensis TaxID=353224 RepID=A0ABU0CUN5_9BACI|nr:RNA polymerase sigma factor [Caldalkalibacillus uzonensis]MDQ0339837.1 RNA polymerase sigma-70 factor (ECF subfamily) [Caldalkalibacillus uzonensis]